MDRKKAVKNVLIAIAVLAVVACVFFAINYFDTRKTGTHERQDSAPDPTYLYLGDLEYEVTHNIKTYLICGTDGNSTRPNAKKYHGPMTDYLLLLIIDKTAGTYGFIQIDRDTMTDVEIINEDGDEESAGTEELQICTATWYGKDIEQGMKNLENSVSYLLGGIEIDGYYMLNMKNIAELNHAVGGVTVKIEDDFSKVDKDMVKGKEIKLTDKQAETFVRSRKNIGDGLNQSRMRRQRVYMEALMDQVKQKMESDKSFALDIYQELEDVALTDIPRNRVSAISNLLYKSEGKGIKDLEGEHTEGRVIGDKQDYAMFYADEEKMVPIFQELAGIGEGHEY